MISSRMSLPGPSQEPPSFDMNLPPAEGEEGGAGFTLAQILAMLRAHLWLSLGIFVALVVAAFFIIKFMPKVYYATATLMVNSDNTDPLAGRNFAAGQMGSYFPTQVELINNSVMLRPVADKLNLQDDKRFTGGFQGDPKTLNDIVVNTLREALDVQPGKGSQMLYISAMADEPVLAAAIANTVAEEYLHQTSQRTNAPAAKRADRYNQQTAELKAKVDEAQERVAQFRQKYGMTELGRNGTGGTEVLTELEDKLRRAQEVGRQLESQSINIRADGVLVQETAEEAALRGRLNELQSELTERSATLGPRHPRIVQLNSEIEATRREIQTSVNSRLSMARNLESRYQAELAAERRKLLDRRAAQDAGEKLMLEQRLAEEAYAQALRGLDAVEFASEGNYQDVELVSRAEPPVTAAKPNKLKLFAAALAASFALALGGPFAYELLLNRRIRCRDDLERGFRIVTLAEFGPIRPVQAA